MAASVNVKACLFVILMFDKLPLRTTTDHKEMTLINELLKASTPYVRPVKNLKESVNVNFGFELVHIVSVTESTQTIMVKVWLRMSWRNHLLTWDAKKWNISSTRLDSGSVWTPDIYLVEDVGDDVASGPDKYKTFVSMYPDGTHHWNVPALLHTSCMFEVANFPYDQQHCILKFISWTHDQTELDIIDDATTPIVVKKNYVNSTSWSLHEVTKKVVSQKYSCCPNPYVHIEFVLTLHRKSHYYFINVVVPCIIQMLIILCTFFLPPDSGERVSVAITVLLVFAVYLDVLNSSLPKTSSSTPALARFYMAAMGGSAFSILTTCFVLVIHFKGAEKGVGPMPKWVKEFFLKKIAVYLWVRQNIREHSDDELLALEKRASYMGLKTDFNNHADGMDNKMLNGSVHEQSHHATDATMTTLIEEVRVITALIHDQNLQEEIEEEWQALAKVFDRLFFIVFLHIFVISSLLILFPVYQAHMDKGR